MKESNILADNVEKNSPVRMLLHNIEDHIMKESDILADNVAKSLPVRVFLQNIEEEFMKVRENNGYQELDTVLVTNFWRKKT